MVEELLGLRANGFFSDSLPGFDKRWSGLIDPWEICIWVGDFFINSFPNRAPGEKQDFFNFFAGRTPSFRFYRFFEVI